MSFAWMIVVGRWWFGLSAWRVIKRVIHRGLATQMRRLGGGDDDGDGSVNGHTWLIMVVVVEMVSIDGHSTHLFYFNNRSNYYCFSKHPIDSTCIIMEKFSIRTLASMLPGYFTCVPRPTPHPRPPLMLLPDLVSLSLSQDWLRFSL